MTAPISTYSPTTWVDGALGNTPIDADNLNKIEQGIVSSFALTNSLRVTPTATKTGTYNPTAGDFAIYSASANLTNTLPKATVGARIKLKKIDATAFTVTFNVASGDTIDSSATSLTLRLQNETRTLMGVAGGWWVVDGLNPLSGLDARYLQQAQADVRYAGPVVCEARPTGTTALTGGANTMVGNTGWSAPIDPYSMFSANGDTYRATLPVAGRYDVELIIFQSATPTVPASGAAFPLWQARIHKNRPNNTSATTSVTSYGILSNTVLQQADIACITRGSEVFAANDYLTMSVYATASCNINQFSYAATKTKLVVRYVGPN